MAGPYRPRASDVFHKYLNNQSFVPSQGLDSADLDSFHMLLLPQLWSGGGGGCEGTSPSGIGTRHAVALPGRGGSGSRRATAQCEAGTAGPAPQRVVPGSQPTQCNTLGLARGSGPFEPPTGESSPLAPPSPPPLPSPSPMTEPSMAREATATKVCGASRPRARRGIASTGSRCAVAPWRSCRRRGRSNRSERA